MHIERSRGDTAPDEFTVSVKRTRKGANITGCSFKMTLSTVPEPTDQSTQVYQLEGSLINPETGVVSFSPTEDQSNIIGYFYYDIQMTDTYGKIRTLVKGTYEYTQDITK